MRYKTIFTYKLDGSDNWSSSWKPISGTGYFESCSEGIGDDNQPCQYRITKMEITRDGQTSIVLDTFLIRPDVKDTLKLYY